jgi:tRNA U34 5-methylaminomethyl-2-thiouridine-forming methyltransferase MnmC
MLNLIKTVDGSNSLLNTDLDETYHSRHGAIQESLHVFIKSGLKFWLEQNQSSEISILEVGFGTGLNALLALQESFTQKIKFRFTTIEAFPVSVEFVNQLNYAKQLSFESSEKFFHDLHAAAWNTEVGISPNFFLKKIQGKIQDLNFENESFDVVFFDAFAPNKQPEMWEKPILEKIFKAMRNDSVFVTYCAKGQLKRDLKSIGFKVEALPGPPGKREMVRARIL